MALRGISGAFSRLQEKIRNMQRRISRYEEDTDAPRKISLPGPDKPPARMVVEISPWSATKIILLIFTAFLLFSFLERITSILILLFVSIFFAITLTPGVDRLQRWGIPRGIG